MSRTEWIIGGVISVIAAIIIFFCIKETCNATTRPIDARYTPSYQGIETTYEYTYDIFSDEGFKKVPNTHSTIFPEKYEIQYEISYPSGTYQYQWREVTKEEYEAFVNREV